ncbi:MAG: N-acetylmuramoyl-L-alanine amidase [Bacteroidales bacterium]|nr:N-acetylmuramoyl-L-alanine amidase [Bacteroidales bacterium]
MSTGVKNGKHRTNNIYILKILLLLNLLIFLSYKASAQGGDKNWVIVIDAGHGGKDPGAVGSFSFEKNLTLAVALKTGSYIEKNLKKCNRCLYKENRYFCRSKGTCNYCQ